jgi:hypothetical protein
LHDTTNIRLERHVSRLGAHASHYGVKQLYTAAWKYSNAASSCVLNALSAHANLISVGKQLLLLSFSDATILLLLLCTHRMYAARTTRWR